MRILLDECVNPRLRLAFPGDSVKTVAEMGWRSLTNGRLMKEAVSLFDVFQNPTGSNALGVVVLVTRFNHLAAYRQQFGEIRDVTRRTKPGQVNVLQIR
jgi:hypothetical protein